MRNTTRFTGALGLALVTLTHAPPTAAGQAARDTLIDTTAVNALEKMGEYLRTLKAFQVRAVTTRDEVTTTGEKIQYSGTADLIAERPGKLRLDVNEDRHQRIFIYDGKTFTLWAPRTKYYATVPAPATIAELAERLEDSLDVDMPFVDLFRWGTDDSGMEDLKSARNIGPSAIDGTSCQHYSFRQDGMDWQIWIQNGDFPVPRKLVVTTVTDEARPQYTAVYSWNLAPAYNDAAFAFVPAKDAMRIPLVNAAAARTIVSKGGKKP